MFARCRQSLGLPLPVFDDWDAESGVVMYTGPDRLNTWTSQKQSKVLKRKAADTAWIPEASSEFRNRTVFGTLRGATGAGLDGNPINNFDFQSTIGDKTTFLIVAKMPTIGTANQFPVTWGRDNTRTNCLLVYKQNTNGDTRPGDLQIGTFVSGVSSFSTATVDITGDAAVFQITLDTSGSDTTVTAAINDVDHKSDTNAGRTLSQLDQLKISDDRTNAECWLDTSKYARLLVLRGDGYRGRLAAWAHRQYGITLGSVT